MALSKDKKGKLYVSEGSQFQKLALKKIALLNSDKLYSTPSMNRYGREFAYYLCNSSYHQLVNPEPINAAKNTLSKCLTRIAVIDAFFKRPIEEYTFALFNNFISAFVDGRIVAKKGTRPFRKERIRSYVGEFKRFHKVYRQCCIAEGKRLDPSTYDWVQNLHAPRMKKSYEAFPYKTEPELIYLANQLHKDEYTVRMLLSINLMGRKCEMSAITRRHVDIRPDGSVWVTLPDVKKHSSDKVAVELFTFVKKPFLDYLHIRQFQPLDRLFPTAEGAFAANLTHASESIFRERITPKTLRKIGVYVAENLGYSRAEIERIGGWSVNSDVLNHYFMRKPVAAISRHAPGVAQAVQQEPSLEMDMLRQKYRQMEAQHQAVQERLARMEELERLLGRKALEVTART